ncbi:aspartate/glutamate racemase family protein [Desulfobacter curvatus]|uniref:aspartate/glutamate racemase family protein n=1 Tax=Desulfobacter curvatus TaxID=2290 RepID=UPI00036A06E7|nr:aspartate/glutamate racemase family protein [Desulfobacter curvatus]
MSDKKKITLLVTDSGLGGLSVCAGMAARFANDARYERIHLVYFNAWPEQEKGYRHYPNPAARAKVFHNAMTAMAKYNPDHIYIACNTLSVVYPFTRFAKETTIPVTGIVDHGVQMIYNALTRNVSASAVIFATPITIHENSHKKALIDRGIAPERIITQGCLALAGKIERTPFSNEVKTLIDEFAAQAAHNLKNAGSTVYAGLCCTHFGYCKNIFKNALARHTNRKVEVLNPNEAMTDVACQGIIPGGSPQISINIVSRVSWKPAGIKAYERLLSKVSPDVADALKNYRLDRQLFRVEIE